MNAIIDWAQIKVLFAVSTKVRPRLASLNPDACLSDIVVIDQEEDPSDFAGRPQTTIHVHSYQDAVTYTGPSHPLRTPSPSIATHSNMIGIAAAVVWAIDLCSADSVLSCLPLAYIFEAAVHVVGLKVFGKVQFWSIAAFRTN